MDEVSQSIYKAIDGYKGELIDLSHRIHENPELSGSEFKAAAWQVELLRAKGFEVELGVGSLETAYTAKMRGKGKGPVVAFLAEYDALAGLGHACGHNIIAACAIGATLGLSSVVKGLDGEVRVIGCPDEEVGAGKIHLLRAGVFEDVDFVLEVHPGNKNMICRGSLACVEIGVEYFGKSAHSSQPGSGINALSALIMLFQQVDMLRQKWNTWWIPRANGIITDGGKATNVITPYAKGAFLLRANRSQNLQVMLEDFLHAAKIAADSVGAEVQTNVAEFDSEIIPNREMGLRFAEHMKDLGEEMNFPAEDERRGSSDIGEISHHIPTIHEYIRILDTGGITHTEAFRDAAVRGRADEAIVLASKGMALTGYDLLTDSNFREKVRKEFAER